MSAAKLRWPICRRPIRQRPIEANMDNTIIIGTVITKPILLDTVTDRLGRVEIRDGGKLVFQPNGGGEGEMSKLTARQVRVGADGELWIGSDDCRFEGNAEIMLTGKRLIRLPKVQVMVMFPFQEIALT